MDIDRVVDILADTLYTVISGKISIRRAFTKTCSIRRCSGLGLSREELYEAARVFTSNYHRLRYIASRCGRSRVSYKMLARLFIYIHYRQLHPLGRLEKKIHRDFPSLEKVLSDTVEPWVKYSYPRWLYEELLENLPAEEVSRLMEKMNTRIYWIRVNTLRIDIDKALKSLEEEGVLFQVDKDTPFLLRVEKSPKPLRQLKLFKNNEIVLQDKASVLVVKALKPEPGMVIYDYTAAPGVKTSLIMQLTENRARVVAVDISPRRLYAMKKLLVKYGVNVNYVNMVLSDSRIIEFEKRADIALIDAPCSSSGAISKDPAIKIFLSSKNPVYEMKKTQLEILSNTLNQVDRVVYATCSILPEEGEEVVEEILRRGVEHRLVDPDLGLPRGYSRYKVSNLVHRTFPHINNCEGFFIARLEK